MATIFHVLGINLQQHYVDQSGRPQFLLPDGARQNEELEPRKRRHSQLRLGNESSTGAEHPAGRSGGGGHECRHVDSI
jgi:hypothetical protein